MGQVITASKVTIRVATLLVSARPFMHLHVDEGYAGHMVRCESGLDVALGTTSLQRSGTIAKIEKRGMI